MADYPVSDMITMNCHIDRSTVLVTATPVEVPLVGQVYHKSFYATQDGCLRGISARNETAPIAGDAALEVGMTINGTPLTGAKVTGATGGAGLHKEGTFKNGAYPFAEGDLVGAYIMQTGTITGGAVVNEVDIQLLLQFGKSNI
jgi:hypothetical protein